VTEIVAVDIDLRKLTAVSSWNGVVANRRDPGGDTFPLPASLATALVLVEIGGPVMHHAESHSFRRWLIYNVAMASKIASMFPNVHVADSTTWTRGYSEENRQALAGIHPGPGGKYVENHDVRECRAMLYFHSKAPHLWVPLDKFLTDL